MLILWINNSFTSRPHYVKYSNVKSDIRITNTGAPQGCVLSPLLFTLYTSSCRSVHPNCKLFKYADDTALVANCTSDDGPYRVETARFVKWCEENFLELNVTKTKELITDFRISEVEHQPLYINNEPVETVHEYKYLGTIIDDKFNFTQNVQAIHKKVHSRVFFLRQLRKLHLDDSILKLFYTSVIQSVISFSITCWFGNSTQEATNRLNRVIETCKRLGASNASTLKDIYEKCVLQRTVVIRADTSHPLNSQYQLLPSGRRLRSIKCRTTRYSNTFIPASIKALNRR